MRKCSVCGDKESLRGDGRKECRPYGKDGALICYDCAMKPAHIATTKRESAKVMNAAIAASPVIKLTRNGPKPVRLGKS